MVMYMKFKVGILIIVLLLVGGCTPINDKHVEHYGDVIQENQPVTQVESNKPVSGDATSAMYLNEILNIDDLASADQYLGDHLGDDANENDEMVMLVIEYLLDRSYFFDQDMEAGILTLDMIEEALDNNGFWFFYEYHGHLRVNYGYFMQYEAFLSDDMKSDLALAVRVDEDYYLKDQLTIDELLILLEDIVSIMKHDHNFKSELFMSKADIYEMMMYSEEKYSFFTDDGLLKNDDLEKFRGFVDQLQRPNEKRILERFMDRLVEH